MKSITVIAVIAALIVSACVRKSEAPAGALTKIELQQEWFPFAGFAGEVSAAKRFASGQNIELLVKPGSEQVDPIKLVLAKTAPVGVVGGDLLVAAVAKGAPLVAIGVVNERSPTVFLVPTKSSINGPKDFPGKKVGILSGTNTERIYELMAKRTGIDRTKVHEIQAPFDLQTFIMGEYDVRPAFIYDETVSLEQKGIAVRILKPEDFGVQFTGTVYFVRRDYLAQNRETVVKLLRALVQGWRFALADPAKSIDDLVAAFPELNRARELRALELGRPYFSGHEGKPLQCSEAAWAEMIKGLEEIGVLKAGQVTLDQVWDPRPLQEAYK